MAHSLTFLNLSFKLKIISRKPENTNTYTLRASSPDLTLPL